MSTRILYNELRRKNPDLANQFMAIYQESLKIWEEQYLRQFTVHGKLHTAQVERNLDYLTRPLNRSAADLTAEEIFVLLSACCLHDIGMQLVDDPDARAKHAQYAYDLILFSHAQIGPEHRRVTLPINDNNSRHAIALIARSHWTDYALKLNAEDFIVGNERGRLRLLGVLLAMADLLDISPVRARYFRSIHHLYDLPPVSEMHQQMHDLVKGFQILAPNEEISGDLQFQLEWRADTEAVHMMSDWVMTWFDSQWRQLWPNLYTDSSGIIRWTKPWAAITFNAPEGPIQEVSPEALKILQAELTEQTRINREQFIDKFKSSIRSGEACLFLYPRESDFDGRAISDWFEAYVKLQENCLIARVDIQPSAPLDLSSIISQLMEQWGQHLPRCTDDEAIEALESFVLTNQTQSFVCIIVTEVYRSGQLNDLLEILLQHSPENPNLSRVCLLLSRGAEGPKHLSHVSIFEFDGSGFSEDDVKQYLQTRLGYDENASRNIYTKLSQLGFAEKPGQIYNYVRTHCGLLASGEYE